MPLAPPSSPAAVGEVIGNPALKDQRVPIRAPRAIVKNIPWVAVPEAKRRAVTIVDAEQLGGVMLEKLAELFEDEGAGNTLRQEPPPPRRLASGTADLWYVLDNCAGCAYRNPLILQRGIPDDFSDGGGG